MSISMFLILFVFKTTTPLTLIICIICLSLLFLETAFGICIGCKLYNLINKDKAKYCPGGVCKIKRKEEIQKTNAVQIIILLTFIIVISYLIIFDPIQNLNVSSCTASCISK